MTGKVEDMEILRELPPDVDVEELCERMSVDQDVYVDNPRRILPESWERVFDSKEIEGNRKEGFFGALYRKHSRGVDEWMICFRGYNGRTDIDDLWQAVRGKKKLPDQVRDACIFTQAALKKFDLDIKDVDIVG